MRQPESGEGLVDLRSVQGRWTGLNMQRTVLASHLEILPESLGDEDALWRRSFTIPITKVTPFLLLPA